MKAFPESKIRTMVILYVNGELFKIFRRAAPEGTALVSAVTSSTLETVSTAPLAIFLGIPKAWKKVSRPHPSVSSRNPRYWI